MTFRDDGSVDLTGTAERELFDVKLGQSGQIRQKPWVQVNAKTLIK